jgi:hypothetical protein
MRSSRKWKTGLSLSVPFRSRHPLELVELLVGEREIGRRQRVVRGAQEELAVKAGLVGDSALVYTKQAVGAPAHKAKQRASGAWLADELVAALLCPGVGALDLVLEVGNQVLAHTTVSRCEFGVVTDTEAL